MVPRSELIGRAGELARLRLAVDALASGRGALFVLSGEAGIGKTRLADEACAGAAGRGATIVWGAAWEGGGAPALWPWIQVLRALRPRLPAPDERLAADLGPLWDLPGAPATSADPELEQFRRFDALRAVLAAAARAGPLVVVLDDLHAADRASLLATLHVARALRTLPILLIATQREADVQADPDRAALLARIAREGTTLRLPRLDREQVAELLAGLDAAGDAARLAEIVEASAGNPLFVTEVARGGHAGTPDSLAEVIGERLARFEPGTRDALEAAAVLGRELDLPVLADVLGVTVAAAHARLRPACAAGVLDDDRAGALRFAHGLFRERLEEELPASRRTTLHLRAGEALARLRAAGHEAAEEAVARHLLAALPDGDPARAVEWAVRAAERARRALAHDRAAALLEGALGVRAQAQDDPEHRIDLTLSLAEALAAAGEPDRAAALCRDVAVAARARGDAVRLGRAALALGAELRVAFVDRALIGLLEEALGLLGDGAPALRACLLARLAAALQPAPDPAIPVELARDAIAQARATGDAPTLLAALYTGGSALVDYARPEERLGLGRELIALAVARGELGIAQRAYARVAIDYLELGELAECDVAIAAVERLGEALGHPRWRWRAPLFRSMRALIEGRWDDASASIAQAAACAAGADDPNAATALALHRIGALRAAEAGRPDEADPGWAALDAVESGPLLGAVLRAATLARLGDGAAARRIAATLPLDHWLFMADAVGLSLLAEVAATGDAALAAALLPRLEPMRDRTLTWGLFGMIWEGPATQWLGELLGVVGRWDEAIAALERAREDAIGLGARPLAGRLHARLAAALLRRDAAGDRARAAALLDDAAAVAADLSMRHLASRVAELRGGTPTSPRRPPPAAPALAAPTIHLERAGEVWNLTHAGRTVLLRHSRAVEILAELLRNPGRELHVLDLASDAGPVDGGDAGPLLDAAARGAYGRRIATLTAALHEAQEWNDAGRSGQLRAELEFLEEELARGVGLGGRDRAGGRAVERARVNVQKRLRGVIRRIAAELPDLGRHLENAVKTGTYVVYRP